ncbi:glutaredoxin family protein [Falsibacillus albus]|uniref:Glutaredoxin family protein n=1 Tax=Falsibacillus albus TaxID=2478915 RepID=A0A3L7K1K2_9BACI|nr:glutaredoxin family protein [Falsibacillus albus]RLQ96680.1 glutaredoxin family protein [Falsibacillus albus]
MKQEITFYTREQCSLCRDAKVILELLKDHHDFNINEVDIEGSDDLTERFGLLIPVVEIEGEIIQYGQIDPIVISNRLHQKC